MNFLGLGPGELFLIMVLALIVFGPQKLPEIGAGLGRAIGEFRRASSQITEEINRELRLETQAQEPRRQQGPVVIQDSTVDTAPVVRASAASGPAPLAAPSVEEPAAVPPVAPVGEVRVGEDGTGGAGEPGGKVV